MFREGGISKLLKEDNITQKEEYVNIINKYKNDNNILYKNNLIRNIFLNNILRKSKGKYDWKRSIGYSVYFIYDNIEGWIEIVDYDKNYLTIKYQEYQVRIHTGNFIDCMLGTLLKKRTLDFKIEVETRYRDNKRDITIIDEEVRVITKTNEQNQKWYKYHCNKDGYEDWMIEYDILKGHGCNVCCGHTVIEGINDIPTTAPWMVKYFQGGYDEAKMYTRRSNQKISPICPDCLRIKTSDVKINDIYKYHSIKCSCSDKIPYPEKTMFSILEQLGINFQTQLSKKDFKWCNRYKYDFYFKLNDEDFVIETNGMQHYKDAWDKLEVTQENDKNKKELTLNNGIKEENYIVIDCRWSELTWIKEHILEKDKLNKLFDLSQVDWLKAEEFASSNLVKFACDYKNNNPNIKTGDIACNMKLDISTIQRYFKTGRKLKWL
jgi:hypothetical protein